MSEFLKGMESARQRKMQAALKAIDQFGEHVLGDAQQLTPVDTGALQASGSTRPAEVQGDGINKEIGFNTDYAAAVHECLESPLGNPIHHPVGQAKFLETALSENAPKLGPFLAERLKDA